MLVEIYTLDSVAICDTRVGLSENLRYLLFYSNSKLIVLLSENEKGLFLRSLFILKTSIILILNFRSDSKAILAIHNHMVTNNPRMTVGLKTLSLCAQFAPSKVDDV